MLWLIPSPWEGIQYDGHNLVFHFLKSSWRSLLLEARYLAWNSPNTVWRPGSARTRWGAKALPRPPSRNNRDLLLRVGEGGREGRGGGRERGGGMLQGVRGDRCPCSFSSISVPKILLLSVRFEKYSFSNFCDFCNFKSHISIQS